MNDSLTPKAIVRALDEHIIGQAEAKRAVAVALRNRWRRQRLSPELRDEVSPKNILMIGPTGCGKTEISRRLAKLADAPFVKVEATKFTEVGYVGRDVEQIARDLVEEAVRLERERRREAVKGAAEAAAIERLLDALTGKDASAATRESFRRMLGEGHLNDREVEIDVADQPQPRRAPVRGRERVALDHQRRPGDRHARLHRLERQALEADVDRIVRRRAAGEQHRHGEGALHGSATSIVRPYVFESPR